MSKLTPNQTETAELFDAYVLKILRQGGIKIVTDEGKVEIIDISAAMLNAIRGRLKDLGATSTAAPGSTASGLLEAARLRYKGKEISPISEEDDAATA